MIKSASVCLVPLKKDKLFEVALPSKLFEYMACGKPIICNNGECGDLVYELHAGRVVKPDDPRMLADSILYYFNNNNQIISHGKNGYDYVKNNMIKDDLIAEALNDIISLRK